MAKRQQKTSTPTKNLPLSGNETLTFIEHIHELRKRLVYIALSVGIFTAAAYSVQQQLVVILLKPAGNQQFIYTSVGGGIDFLFRVCIYTAIAISIPVIFYQILKYVEPLIKQDNSRFIAIGSIVSAFLAIGGLVFGYFIGLPAALHFLLHQFTTTQIHPLITAQAYIKFVMVYMLGSAIMFQIPLIVLFINRIKPLKPKTLFRYERWVILFAFVISGLMNPTPNLLAQLIIVGPIIISYQISIVLVFISNRPKRLSKVEQLLAQDYAIQQAREAKRLAARPLPLTSRVPTPAIAATAPLSARRVTKLERPLITTPRAPRVQRGRDFTTVAPSYHTDRRAYISDLIPAN